MDDQFDISDVSIEIGSQFYNTFKDIQNTASHVFAEFVDNALQSYRDHATRLHELEPGYKLQVNIDVEWEPGGDRARKIIISDNARSLIPESYHTSTCKCCQINDFINPEFISVAQCISKS